MKTTPPNTPSQRPASGAGSRLRRLALYVALLIFLAIAYFAFVALLQVMSQALTGPQSNLLVVAITLAIATLFNPLRDRFQTFIDRRFYREKVDFRQAFTNFAREVRTIIDLPELLRTLVTRTTDLLHITHGAVFLTEEVDDKRTFRLVESRNLPDSAQSLTLRDPDILQRSTTGSPSRAPDIKRFRSWFPSLPRFPIHPVLPTHPSPNRSSASSRSGRACQIRIIRLKTKRCSPVWPIKLEPRSMLRN
jgi:hypothetical protein